MIEKISSRIKISVKTAYNGTVYRNNRLLYLFDYFISIENKSEEAVQLTQRYWTIFDTLNNIEFVEGKGVIGETPILQPSMEYHYKSNCFLSSNIGAMKGFYKMINLSDSNEFLVTIPTFQLITMHALN